MENNYWENCSYYERGECPQPRAIDRAFLIPHLLNRAEIQEIEDICRRCGKYLEHRRKHPRVKRPLQIILLRGRTTSIEGDVLNISEGGALIKLQKWVDFDKDEKVVLKIYPATACKKTSTSTLKVSAQVIRKDAERKQVAVIFLGELDH